MIKKFEEFVNEGLITDYKKQKEAENREISTSDKKFVLDVLNKLDEVEMPFVFVCKNCGIISNESVDKSKVEVDREKIHTLKEALDFDISEIHITEKSVLMLLDDDNEWLAEDTDYKNIWSSINKWFDKAFEGIGKEFDGKVGVDNMISLKPDIKKGLF